MSHVLSITVGRNYPGGVLDVLAWETFQDEVAEVLTELAVKRQLEATNQGYPDAFFIEKHAGIGEWDGAPEESSKITVVSEFLVTGKSDAITKIHEIARCYGQEAFALTVGESVLYEITPVYQG